MTKLLRMFMERASAFPDKIFLASGGGAGYGSAGGGAGYGSAGGPRRDSYSEVASGISAASKAFADAGFAPGTVLGLAVAKAHNFPAYFLGMQAAGLVPLLLNLRAGRDEMQRFAVMAGIETIVTDGFTGFDPPLLTAAGREIAFFCPDAPADGGFGVSGPVLSDDTIFLLTTSGTGGNPKIVKKKEAPINRQSDILFPMIAQSDGPLRYFVNVPLWHSYGIEFAFFGAIHNGAELHAADFSFAASSMKYVADEGITHVFSVPPFLAAFAGYAAAEGRGSFQSLEMAISAGMRIPPRTERSFFDAFGFNISSVYGITEVGCVAFRPSRRAEEVACTDNDVGSALEGNRIFVVPDADDSAAGRRGRIMVEKAVPDGGYFGREAGGEKWSADLRTFDTDDTGYFDAAGSLHLLGRSAAYINVGGEKVNSFDVENALRETNLVTEALVWAGRDEILGEAILAAVVLREGVSATGDEIRARCIEALPMIKVPRTIAVFGKPFPKTATGKIRFDEVVREFSRLTERTDAR